MRERIPRRRAKHDRSDHRERPASSARSHRLFREFCDLPSEALQYDNGYRSGRYTWAQVGNAACTFSARLRAEGIAPGGCVMIWSENRPEWVAAFWGCLLAGAIVVPMDYRSSAGFVQHVQDLTGVRLILTGDGTLTEIEQIIATPHTVEAA